MKPEYVWKNLNPGIESKTKQIMVFSSRSELSNIDSASLKIQYTKNPQKIKMPQSIRRMHQYGSEFFVKYQFNNLSNGRRITQYSQNRRKGTKNSPNKQIIPRLFIIIAGVGRLQQ
jgi:hypothetical protein